MKGATMLVMLQRLGVVPSFSRPAVSNDNPYSESLFNTVKGRPDFPSEPFDCVEAARRWVEQFVAWYNNEHLHSALKFVTPAQRHRGEDVDLLAQREALYQAARARQPDTLVRTHPQLDATRFGLAQPGETSSRQGQLRHRSDVIDATTTLTLTARPTLRPPAPSPARCCAGARGNSGDTLLIRPFRARLMLGACLGSQELSYPASLTM